jgi:hypothetical protein
VRRGAVSAPQSARIVFRLARADLPSQYVEREARFLSPARAAESRR